MKVKTDFGIQNIKPSKTFLFKKEKFAICNVPSKLFKTDVKPTVVRKLVHFDSGKLIPLKLLTEKTVLNCVESAEKRLKKIFGTVGEEYFYSEINKQKKLN